MAKNWGVAMYVTNSKGLCLALQDSSVNKTYLLALYIYYLGNFYRASLKTGFPRYSRGLHFRVFLNLQIPKPPLYAAKIRLKLCFSLVIRGFPLFSGPRMPACIGVV
jgi:hypothetical protein